VRTRRCSIPPRELQTEALDADTSVAEADELAEAQARAEAARARAVRLRQQAEAASSDQGNQSGAQEAEGEAESAPSRRRRLHWRLRRPGRKALAAAAAVVISCGSLAASGYLLWQHHDAVQQRQRTAQFATAARNAILTMLTINASTARADVQRFADQTTGQFKAMVLLSGEDYVKALEQSKVSSKAAVQAVAVQSMTQDSAVVLVAAKSELTKPDQAKPESRSWRVVVNLETDGGQLKISKVEFTP
jgi:Mce-associated membrane protein